MVHCRCLWHSNKNPFRQHQHFRNLLPFRRPYPSLSLSLSNVNFFFRISAYSALNTLNSWRTNVNFDKFNFVAFHSVPETTAACAWMPREPVGIFNFHFFVCASVCTKLFGIKRMSSAHIRFFLGGIKRCWLPSAATQVQVYMRRTAYSL